MKKAPLLILAIFIGLITRLPFLSTYPSGLNADEAALGYNAYSLIQTGKDEHGAAWPLVFQSFDDYKPGGYVYLSLPFIYLLGLNPLAIRLPSALLGILAIYFLAKLVDLLFDQQHQLKIGKITFSLGDVSALFLSLSPWHLHFSRGAWEVNASSSLWLIGLFYLIRFIKTKKNPIVGILLLIFSMYTYHSTRVVLPLTLIALAIFSRDQVVELFKVSKTRNLIFKLFVVSVILLIPLSMQMFSKEGRSRFGGVSVFADSGPLWEALEYRNGHDNQILNKVFHSKYITYSRRILSNYLLHFSPKFLFVTGDEIARSKVPGVGQELLALLPLFGLGLWYMVKQGNFASKFILSWFLLAPLAASLTFQAPHALRAQNMIYPLVIICGLGFYQVLMLVHQYKFKFILLFLTLLLSYDFSRYLHQYFVHYPKELPYAWQYGFSQISDYLTINQEKYSQVVISDRYDQPYILIAFFQKYPPSQLQKEIILTPRDKFGFSTVKSFSKYQFRAINFEQDKDLKNALLVLADEPAPDDKVIDTIKDPAGKVMYRFIATP